jgi:hypothetical protein
MWNVDDLLDVWFNYLSSLEGTHLSAEEATLATLAANEVAVQSAREVVIEAKVIEICIAILVGGL